MQRWTRRTCLAMAGTGLLFALPLRAEEPAPVPAGTVVMLEFLDEVSSRKAKKGDEVRLRVYADVVVNGKTLIRQDSPALGVVSDVRRPGIFGRKARLNLSLREVKDLNGRRVPLEAYTSGERFKGEGPGAAAGGLLILGPVGLVGGAFVKGNHITIDKGTRIQAVVPGKEKPATPVRRDEIPPVEWPERRP